MDLSYEIIRSSRTTLAIQITPEGRVLVRCPRRMRTEDVQRFVREKTPWILRRLDCVRSQPRLPVLTDEQLRELTVRAKADLTARVAHWAPQVGVCCGRITIRHQHSLWGSCSAQGNLNFNCLLMLTPDRVRDYVVVHELCHRIEMNHSPAFWAQVERVLPDYRQQRGWLSAHGAALIGRLPNF